MATLLDKLAPEFNYVIRDFGFVISKEEVSKSFGNAIVVLRSDLFDLCISRDRSQILASVRLSGPWRSLDNMLEFILGKDNVDFGGPPSEIPLLAASFRDNVSAISALLRSETEMHNYELYLRRRAAFDRAEMAHESISGVSSNTGNAYEDVKRTVVVCIALVIGCVAQLALWDHDGRSIGMALLHWPFLWLLYICIAWLIGNYLDRRISGRSSRSRSAL